MRVESLNRLRRWLQGPVGITLVLLLALWAILTPAEAQLGNLIKLVYVHGALVLAGLAAFSVAGIAALVALASQRPAWDRGAGAAGLGALLVWIPCVLSAMAVTGLAWGQLVAWNEPRVRVTVMILGAAAVLELVIRLVSSRVFAAVVRVVMGVAPWLSTRQAEVIRHPADPIGSSGSASMQAFFFLILLTTGLLVLDFLAWLWVKRELASARAVVTEHS